MSILKDILYKVTIDAIHGSTAIPINKIEFDSRNITKNDLFVSIKGTASDGHQFIEKAISLGATAIVCEDFPENLNPNITYIKVKNTKFIIDFYQFIKETNENNG